jgi:hypothetical protein
MEPLFLLINVKQPIDPIARFLSSFNMKWQEQICHQDAWKSSDCFLRVNRTLADLKSDWTQKLRTTVTKELRRLQYCLEPPRHTRSKALTVQEAALPSHNGLNETPPAIDNLLENCLNVGSGGAAGLMHTLEDHSHIHRSLYIGQLKRWFDRFDASSFLIWSSEEFERQPQKHMREFVSWIGADPESINEDSIGGNHHQREYVATMPADIKQQLLDFFAPHNEHLFQFLNERGFHDQVQSLRRHFERIE